VRRTDGTSEPGGKHADCAYFVLDLEHDEHAIPAIEAYAASCERSEPQLAKDLQQIVLASESYPACGCREVGCPHALSQALHRGPSETAGELMARSSEGSPGSPDPRHCDDYIHDRRSPLCLRLWLLVHRLPASDHMLLHEAQIRPALYADHAGRRVRVVMASRLGDVGITSRLDAELGYEARVRVAELSNFSDGRAE